ncbi:hypothetical protein TRFO_07370 [Tritrichomonas foetus]|uniref:Carbohydrate-binding domain-containing protein n=1 Tax=Tritrichomonas foetus TaxID=1144522 RepID=A0A1J4JWB1_9EUKA|nr:hypothetical protein TRFO_07370 [Tritrichomonas foetus]|eukprot:OHT01814.1 hypothetical protein TRFO_07370 [Tritrichomonas foetus]
MGFGSIIELFIQKVKTIYIQFYFTFFFSSISMTLLIPFISTLDQSNLQAASEALAQLEPNLIGNNNWADQYPETPKVQFRIAHNNKEIFLRFDVEEQYTLARVTEDNGEIWTDSTCEFFVSFDELGYYNLEMNCIGRCLIGFGKVLAEQVRGKTDKIVRLPSLGTEPFEEKVGDNKWTLVYAVPASVFWKHSITEFHGKKARANFYKCGDNLTKPHFLSWKPIKTPTPAFHVPEFFGQIEFE